MSVREGFYGFYWKMRSIIAPQLQYSQGIYEEAVKSAWTPDYDWLELGCGHQVLPAWRKEEEKRLVDASRRVIGLDVDLDSLKAHGSISHRVRGDVSQLPFPDESFDFVTSNMVFEHLGEPEIQLAEIHRVLRPGGILLFHTPNRLGYHTILARLIPEAVKDKLVWLLEGRGEADIFPAYYRVNSPKAIRRLGEKVGFEISKIRMVATDAALIMVPPLAAVELVWIRLLMTRPLRPLRPNIIAVLGKPYPERGRAEEHRECNGR